MCYKFFPGNCNIFFTFTYNQENNNNMKISTELIGFDTYSYDNLDGKTIAFLLIIFLHKHNHISREKMMAMFKGLHDDTLLKKRNTHHCKINDKWYSDEGMLSILKDAFKDKMFPMNTQIPYQMDLEEVIKYANLYLNKTRNYCIDFIQDKIVVPFVDAYSHYNYNYNYMQRKLSTFGIPKGEARIVSYEDYYLTGYCCEDCDGDYEAAKSLSYECNVVSSNARAYKKAFTDYLHSQKKTYEHFKIPKKEIR